MARFQCSCCCTGSQKPGLLPGDQDSKGHSSAYKLLGLPRNPLPMERAVSPMPTPPTSGQAPSPVPWFPWWGNPCTGAKREGRGRGEMCSAHCQKMLCVSTAFRYFITEIKSIFKGRGPGKKWGQEQKASKKRWLEQHETKLTRACVKLFLSSFIIAKQTWKNPKPHSSANLYSCYRIM